MSGSESESRSRREIVSRGSRMALRAQRSGLSHSGGEHGNEDLIELESAVEIL